jgi:uncharacterized membrane protein
MEKVFSIEESLKFSWKKLTENSGVLLGASVILFVVNFISGWVSEEYEAGGIGGLGFILLAISIVISIGYTIIGLKVARGEVASIQQLIPPANIAWKYFVVSIALGFLILGGLILLIVPGIYVMVRFMMATYAVIDGAEIWDSFKQSTKLTEGHKWDLLWFVLVLLGINIVGMIPFGLGLLITTPITFVAFAHVYDKLKHKAHAHSEHTEQDHSHEGNTHA